MDFGGNSGRDLPLCGKVLTWTVEFIDFADLPSEYAFLKTLPEIYKTLRTISKISWSGCL